MSCQRTNAILSCNNVLQQQDNTQINKLITPLERLITTQTYNIMGARFDNGFIDPYFFSTFIAGVTAVNINQNSSNLEVSSGSTGGTAIIETKNKVYYIPAKTVETLFTGSLFTIDNNNSVARMGLYSSSDGAYIEYSQGNIYLSIRSSATGSPINTQILKSNWNGYIPDNNFFKKGNIFRLRFLWFGYFYIELSAIVNNVMTILHTVYYTNQQTIPYFKRPSFPFRCEVSTTSGNQLLLHTCHAVNIYGGFEVINKQYNLTNGNAGISITTSITPIVAVRLKSDYDYAKFKVNLIDCMNLSTTNNQYIFLTGVIIFNGSATITGGSWTSLTNSIVEYNSTLTNFSGSEYVIARDILFSSTRNTQPLTTSFNEVRAGLSGRDVFILYGQTNTSTASLVANLQYEEVY